MTIKNAALNGLIAMSVHLYLYFAHTIFYWAWYGYFNIWDLLNYGTFATLLLDGSLILFFGAVYYNHNKKEKMNQ